MRNNPRRHRDRASRQLPLAGFLRRSHRIHGPAGGFPDAFVVAQEEQAVAAQGPAEEAAELVLAQRRNLRGGWIEEVLRVEGAVAQKLVRAAVPLVGARFGDSGKHGAPGPPIFSVERAGHQVQFLDALQTQQPSGGA